VGRVIDSSVLIAMERGELDVAALLRDHRDERIAISAVSASELLHGLHRVKASRRAGMEAFIERVLNLLQVLPFDLKCARIHARLWAECASTGNSISMRDLMIAATALASDHEVVTRDRRSFPRIPGLRVVHW
jgi:tRNA(fMet)-specific endonuclease VapC